MAFTEMADSMHGEGNIQDEPGSSSSEGKEVPQTNKPNQIYIEWIMSKGYRNQQNEPPKAKDGKV